MSLQSGDERLPRWKYFVSKLQSQIDLKYKKDQSDAKILWTLNKKINKNCKWDSRKYGLSSQFCPLGVDFGQKWPLAINSYSLWESILGLKSRLWASRNQFETSGSWFGGFVSQFWACKSQACSLRCQFLTVGVEFEPLMSILAFAFDLWESI